MPEIEFVGGPHDGTRLTTGLGAPFLWTDGKRCYRAPRRGRALYRAMSQSSVALVVHSSVYHFVGNTYVLCPCGVYRQRADRACPMCGDTSPGESG